MVARLAMRLVEDIGTMLDREEQQARRSRSGCISSQCKWFLTKLKTYAFAEPKGFPRRRITLRMDFAHRLE
jgi:hypothetical protein